VSVYFNVETKARISSKALVVEVKMRDTFARSLVFHRARHQAGLLADALPDASRSWAEVGPELPERLRDLSSAPRRNCGGGPFGVARSLQNASDIWKCSGCPERYSLC